MEGLLAAAGADMAAWHYAKRMRRLNLTGKQQVARGGAGLLCVATDAVACLALLLLLYLPNGLQLLCVWSRMENHQHSVDTPAYQATHRSTCGYPPSSVLQPGSASVHEGLSGFGGSAQSQLTSLLGTTFGQGLSSLTKGALRTLWLGQAHSARLGQLWAHTCCVSFGRTTANQPTSPPPSAGVKNLLAGEQQAAVTVAMEALMDGRPSPDTDAYATFDPKVKPAAADADPAGQEAALTWCQWLVGLQVRGIAG